MKNASFISALIYTGISVILAGTFFVITLLGNYSWLTRIGGAFWIFLLSMIILMPVVMPMVKKKLQKP